MLRSPDVSSSILCIMWESHACVALLKGGSPCWREQRTQVGSSQGYLLIVRMSGTMEELTAELARVTAERRRLQRQAKRQVSSKHKQRERALEVATLAYCHEPLGVRHIAEATLRKHGRVMDEDVSACIREIEERFLHTPLDTLANWLDWSSDIQRGIRADAQRLVEDTRLLRWVEDQNSSQGVAPPPQLV